ncbi:hypothetical protein B0T20DRAFT_65671 [Sordaria brevicollis]|uniref:Uncharacterized protein n=1 Tax=Sordaria brevicollis TaxID=83679 RepID=A0AAE0P260_SORBR|nr:hypothetical protein B0T20DRAFT_65671 [Sordaria brevicollis]
MAPSTPWTTTENVDAPFHPQPPNAFFHVAGFPRRKFETSAPPAPLWVRLCSVVGYRTWTPRPLFLSKPLPFVLLPRVSHIDGFCLAASQPAPHSGIWRTEFVDWSLEPMVPVVLQSGIPDTALGSLSAAPAPSDDSICESLAAGRLAILSLRCVRLPASYHRAPRMAACRYIPAALVCFATGMPVGLGRSCCEISELCVRRSRLLLLSHDDLSEQT